MKKRLWPIRLIGIFLFIFILTRIDFSNVLSTVTGVNPWYLAIAVVLNIPTVFLKSWRWHYLLRIQGITYPFRQAFPAYFSGIYLGLVTPSRVGEFGRVFYLTGDKELSLGRAFSSVLVDRLFDIYLVLLVGGYGLIAFSVLPETTCRVMAGLEQDCEVIVANDGSTDNTFNVAKEAGAAIYTSSYNLGLARTFRIEIEKALQHEADIIVHIDADGQYNAAEIPSLVKPILEEHYDLVLGSRFAGTIEQMPLIKRIGNKLLSSIVSSITKIRVSDSQTGFRAFTKSVAQQIEIISTHTYTQEQIIKAVRANFRVKEVPIHFAKRRSGKSRLMSNPFDYAIHAWINLLRIYRDYSPLSFFGWVGFSLIVTSVLVAVYSTLVLGKILDITVVVLLLSGIQIILFGFLADMIRK